ncbi:MAG: right-handed parallel beta-helix repeat-containing protein [Chloroflexi bacterium]|nr:right-handed parallel beta-helix repeat-containing protein [Chloroflexota bacterium]
MKTKLSLLVTLALFVCMVTPAAAHPGTLYVDDDFSPSMPGYGTTYFSNIQDAVDAASDGDSIYVYPGTYTENVAVNKQVYIRSVAGAAATTVDANGAGSGFHVSANGVLIDGFTIVNAKATDQYYCGVFVDGVRGVEVMRNTIHDCQYGIYLSETGSGTTNKVHDNTVYSCTIHRTDQLDGCGIIAWGDSTGNSDLEITDNEVYNCDRQGIFVGGWPETVRSSGVLITRNVVHDNGKAGLQDQLGIQCNFVDDSTISWNEAYNHGSTSEVMPGKAAFGIYVFAGDGNTIRSNYSHDNNYGIVIYGYDSTDEGYTDGLSALNNQIVRNRVEDNWRGIYVSKNDAAAATTVQYNRITGHTSYGVRKYPSDSGTTLVAEYNWWGSSAGPGSGEANGITERVDADPWSTTLALPVGSAISRIKVGESKTLDVKIWADSLYGLQFIVNYDTAPVDKSAHSWASGPWYADYIVWDGVTDEGAGTVKFAASQQRDLHPNNVTLSGDEVADITFLGVASGTSTIHFTNIKLADKDANEYPATIQDHLIIVEARTGSIIGVVNMQGRANDSGAGVYVVPGGYSAVTIANGSFTVSDVPEGSGYTVLAEMARYLDAEKTGVTVTGGGTTDLGTVTLLGGDVNDDDVIDITDLAAIGGQFGNTVDPATTPADINYDGVVDILDLVLAAGNYSLSSPVPWA